eukprot:286124_1
MSFGQYFSFGKHMGETYGAVYDYDYQYVELAKSISNLQGPMKKFVKWIKKYEKKHGIKYVNKKPKRKKKRKYSEMNKKKRQKQAKRRKIATNNNESIQKDYNELQLKNEKLTRELNKKENELNALKKDEDLCIVCLDNNRSHISIPCGHLVLCAQCVSSLKKCPMCQNPSNFTKVF